mgnify:FL=1
MYVDSNGEAHACPFCQTVSGNCISESIDTTILKMQAKGCPRNQYYSVHTHEINNVGTYN